MSTRFCRELVLYAAILLFLLEVCTGHYKHHKVFLVKPPEMLTNQDTIHWSQKCLHLGVHCSLSCSFCRPPLLHWSETYLNNSSAISWQGRLALVLSVVGVVCVRCASCLTVALATIARTWSSLGAVGGVSKHAFIVAAPTWPFRRQRRRRRALSRPLNLKW